MVHLGAGWGGDVRGTNRRDEKEPLVAISRYILLKRS